MKSEQKQKVYSVLKKIVFFGLFVGLFLFLNPDSSLASHLQNPSVNLSASPASILQGQNSTLAWTSVNTTSCSALWTNSNVASGSGIVAPNITTTFSITCFGINGQQVTDQATVFVNQVQQRPAPTVVLFADQESVPFNGTATVRWISANAASCNASGGSLGWTGEKNVGSGSFFTGPLTSSAAYVITCSNNFASATDSVRVAVRQMSEVAAARPNLPVLITSSLDRNQPIVPTIDNTKPRPGDEINYAINYQNIGAGTITGLSLRIDLPLEMNYISSNQNNPTKFGNALIFNLGTLRANGQGSVAVRARLRDDVPAGTKLNFLATLSYIDPSGLSQSVNANTTAEVWGKSTADINKNIFLGANVFGTDFLPRNLFEWLILFVLVLILIFLAKHLYDQSPRKEAPAVMITSKPSNKKNTTNTP